MNRTLDKYRRRQDTTQRWPLRHGDLSGVRQVVVVPLLAEHPGFLDTLADLAVGEEAVRRRTLVLLVVNNRAPDVARAEDIANNLRALDVLEGGAVPTGLRLAWVDASRPGRELPSKEGVGLARKIGLDWALEVLVQGNDGAGGLICLDGDTRVEADYLARFDAYFSSGKRWAAVTEYAHPLDGPEAETRAILCYELFLRYQALSLAWANAPFAYHTIGSAMACTAEAYAACGGMRRKRAGEDFYFLQALGKTGPVDYLRDIVVRPAARPSHRVPFGTGKRVRRFLDATHDEYRLYHPESFRVLRAWFALAAAAEDGAALLAHAEGIHTALAAFLTAEGFEAAWDRIRAQHKAVEAQWLQFHLWCDGLRTLRLLHHLRDNGLPDEQMLAALETCFARHGATPPVSCTAAAREDLAAQRELLEAMRELQAVTMDRGGLV